jgi:hypothetical protein
MCVLLANFCQSLGGDFRFSLLCSLPANGTNLPQVWFRLRVKALRKWMEWSVKNKKLYEERWTRGTSGQKDEFFLFSE